MEKEKDDFKFKRYKLDPNVLNKLLKGKKMTISDFYQQLYQNAARDYFDEKASRRRYQQRGSDATYWLHAEESKRRYFPVELIPALEEIFGLPFAYYIDGRRGEYSGNKGIEYCAFSHDDKLREELKESKVLFKTDEFGHSFLHYCLMYDNIDAIDYLINRLDENEKPVLSLLYNWETLNGYFFDVTTEDLFKYLTEKDNPELFFSLFNVEEYVKYCYEDKPKYLYKEEFLASLFNTEKIIGEIYKSRRSFSLKSQRTLNGEPIHFINPWIEPLIEYGISHFEPGIKGKLISLLKAALLEDDNAIKVVTAKMNENAQLGEGIFIPTLKLEKNSTITQNGFILANFVTINCRLSGEDEIGKCLDYLDEKKNDLLIAINQVYCNGGFYIDSEENTHSELERNLYSLAKEKNIAFLPRIEREIEGKIYFNNVKGSIIPASYSLPEKVAIDCAKKLRVVYDLSDVTHYVHDNLRQEDLVIDADIVSSIIGWNRIRMGVGDEDLQSLCLMCIDEFKSDEVNLARINAVLDAFEADSKMREHFFEKLLKKSEQLISNIDVDSNRELFRHYRGIQTFLIISKK